jgi:ribosomal protein S27AE
MGRKLTLEVFQDIARERGGECLSTEYVNNRTHLRWRCADGHEWFARGDCVKDGNQWCPQCFTNKARLDISVYQRIAEKRGGKLLSTEYENSNSKLLWECDQGHQWEAVASGVKNKRSWCPQCSNNVKLDISVYQKIAEERGGKLLSTEYERSIQKLLWECEQGHQWEATGYSVKIRKSWCPQCSKSKSERLCREIIEDLTGYKFPSVRPKFLKGLELDGYNAEVWTAFEYQGEQHYKYKPFFHEDEGDFQCQQERDQRKYKICQKKGIDLILVPYTLNFRKPDELRTFIRDQLIACGWDA